MQLRSLALPSPRPRSSPAPTQHAPRHAQHATSRTVRILQAARRLRLRALARPQRLKPTHRIGSLMPIQISAARHRQRTRGSRPSPFQCAPAPRALLHTCLCWSLCGLAATSIFQALPFLRRLLLYTTTVPGKNNRRSNQRFSRRHFGPHARDRISSSALRTG